MAVHIHLKTQNIKLNLSKYENFIIKCAVYSISNFGCGEKRQWFLRTITTSLKFAIGLQIGWHRLIGKAPGKQLTRLLPALKITFILEHFCSCQHSLKMHFIVIVPENMNVKLLHVVLENQISSHECNTTVVSSGIFLPS